MYLFNDSVNGDKCKNTVVYLQLITAKWNIENSKKKQAVGGRPPRYASAPSPSSVCAEAPPSASRRRAHRNVAVVSHAELRSPADRCSCLTRKGRDE